MKPRLSLAAKVYLLAVLNLALLAALWLVFLHIQFRVDLHWFLVSPAQDRILAAAGQLGLELNGTERASWDELLQRYSRTYGAELRLLDEDGRQMAGPRTELPAGVAARVLHGAAHGRMERKEGRGPRGRGSPLVFLGEGGSPSRHWVGVPMPLPGGEGRHRPRGLLVVASGAGSMFLFDPTPWLVVGCAALLLSALCWIPFVRGVTKSVSRVTRATGQISEGQFEIQLPVSRLDELGQLSGSINSMAARLNRLVTGQKRFLGDAAHELCSPLARMRVALGILERSATPEQAQVVADLQEDAEQMSTLVNDILSFSKAGLRAPEIHLQPVSVAELVARAVDREAGADTRVVCSVEPQLRVLADPDLLFRALSNVLRNAARYAGAAGPIEVEAQQEGGETAIRIRDCGPGLPPKDLEAVFEPFYRVETARTREGGGVGLGLAIVRTCVEACQGTVHCRNRAPAGLEVEIRLRTASA